MNNFNTELFNNIIKNNNVYEAYSYRYILFCLEMNYTIEYKISFC